MQRACNLRTAPSTALRREARVSAPRRATLAPRATAASDDSRPDVSASEYILAREWAVSPTW